MMANTIVLEISSISATQDNFFLWSSLFDWVQCWPHYRPVWEKTFALTTWQMFWVDYGPVPADIGLIISQIFAAKLRVCMCACMRECAHTSWNVDGHPRPRYEYLVECCTLYHEKKQLHVRWWGCHQVYNVRTTMWRCAKIYVFYCVYNPL